MNRLSLVYAALAALYLAVFEHHASYAGVLAKTLPILLLAAGSARLGRGRWRVWMTGALLFSALGDALLAINAINGNLFSAGLASFLVAQLLYAQLFWRARGTDPARRVYAVLYLGAAGALAWFTLPATGALAPAVAAYMLALAAMVTGAALSDRSLLLFCGALLFALSDGLIAVDRFIQPIGQAGLLIMLSYYLAQLLIWRAAHRVSAERHA